jgi:hypothetical protein
MLGKPLKPLICGLLTAGSLNGYVTDTLKTDAGGKLTTSIQDQIKKKLGYDIDIKELINKIA